MPLLILEFHTKPGIAGSVHALPKLSENLSRVFLLDGLWRSRALLVAHWVHRLYQVGFHSLNVLIGQPGSRNPGNMCGPSLV